MNNIIKRTWRQGTMVNIDDLRGMTFQAEENGHTFEISGVDGNGNAVTLSGTPAGVMLRSDNQDVALTCSVSDGKVYATLPANAYAVPGRFGLTIFLTSDSQTMAIYAAVGTVKKTSSGTVAPPAGADVVDLVNAIAAAVATIPSSYTDMMAAMAPTYSNTAIYAVGQYAWYDGVLKRCIVPITTAESYTAAHWTNANLGGDVTDLKSAFNATIVPVTWEPTLKKGQYIHSGTGATGASNKYARTYDLWDGYKTRIAVVLSNSDYEFYVSYYNSNGALNGTGYIASSDYYKGIAYIPSNAVKIGITFRRVNQANLTDSDITAINAALSAYAPTDTTLTKKGMAADAEKTGWEVEKLYNGIIIQKNGDPFSFIPGIAISNTTGEYITSSDNSQISSKYYIPNDIVAITGLNNAEFRVAAYDGSNSDAYVGMLQNDGSWYSGTPPYHKSVDFYALRKSFPNYKYKLTVHDSSATAITQAYASNLRLDISSEKEVERIDSVIWKEVNPAGNEYRIGGISSGSGGYTDEPTQLSTNDYLKKSVKRVVGLNNAEFRVAGYEDGVYKGMLNGTETEINSSTSFHKNVDFDYLRSLYPTYEFKLTVHDSVSQEDITKAYLSNIVYTINDIDRLAEKDTEIDQEISVTNDRIDSISATGGRSLDGKILAGLGDSIMKGATSVLHGESGTFIEYIATQYNADYVNYSYAGACLGGTQHNYDIWKQSDLLIASGTTPDFVIFNGGINDIWMAGEDVPEEDKQDEVRVPIGEITTGFDSSQFDKSTFSGAFEHILYSLSSAFPSAKIIFIATHNAGSRDYSLQVQYRQRALDICKKYSVRVADVYLNGEMNTNITAIRNAFTRQTQSGQGADGTHPNYNGYTKKYFPVIAEQINNS